ncbi:MAG: orotidine-5'-phosphate decarboxylase [Rhodospirillales bacterium]|nr:orotidine-5'-phosphate decarboxylase [Rhodospirillales bacterium]
MSLSPTDRIFVALDTPDVNLAVSLAEKLQGHVGGVKLGMEFYYANGPQGARAVTAVGMPLFLDLKFHDIPNTVAGAVRSTLELNPAILNVHAQGGPAMMQAAGAALDGADGEKPLLIAVTVLTSLGDDDLEAIGVNDGAENQVVRLAKLTQTCGLGGVVCSPREIKAIRAACGPDFKLVVPGIRPEWAAAGDQKRITTPAQAIRDGADYIVIGRPITGADNPVDAAKRIADELAGL